MISAAGLAGVWFAPLAGAAAWTLLLGLGQGAALGLAIYFTAARAPDPVTSASLSAFAQGPATWWPRPARWWSVSCTR